jgi:hypothetical protein
MACQCIYRDRSNTQRDSNSIAGRFCQLPQRYSPISRHRSLVAQPPTTTRRAGRSVAAHRKHSTCRSASSGTETPLKQIRAIAVRRRRRERLDNARTPHAPRGAGPHAWSSIRARLVPRAHRPARRRLPWIPGTRRTPCPPRPLQRRHWLQGVGQEPSNQKRGSPCTGPTCFRCTGHTHHQRKRNASGRACPIGDTAPARAPRTPQCSPISKASTLRWIFGRPSK